MYFWLALLLVLNTGSTLAEEDDFRVPKVILDIDKERMLNVEARLFVKYNKQASLKITSS